MKMPGYTGAVVWANMNDSRREFEPSMTESVNDCGKVIVVKISSEVRGTKNIVIS